MLNKWLAKQIVSKDLKKYFEGFEIVNCHSDSRGCVSASYEFHKKNTFKGKNKATGYLCAGFHFINKNGDSITDYSHSDKTFGRNYLNFSTSSFDASWKDGIGYFARRTIGRIFDRKIEELIKTNRKRIAVEQKILAKNKKLVSEKNFEEFNNQIKSQIALETDTK